MPGPFGINFAPTADNSAEAQQQQQQIRRSTTPLKVLNLNLPTTINPRAPISRTLLEPQPNVGGNINPDAAVLASIVRALTGSNMPLPGAGMTTPSTDTYAGWRAGERALNEPRPAGGSSDESPRYDAGTGQNPIPRAASPVPQTASPISATPPDPGPGSGGGGGSFRPPTFIPQDPGEGPGISGGHGGLEADPAPYVAPVDVTPQGPFGGDTADDWARRERELNGRSVGPFTTATNVPAYKRELYGNGYTGF